MFDLKCLVEKIYEYGFCKLAADSGIGIKRLMEIIDGISVFNGDEIIIVSCLLGIYESDINSIFFTYKIAFKQFC